MSNNNSQSGGIGFSGLLTITFIVLQLCGVINWSWWWVLSPLWIPLSLVVVVFIFYFLYQWLIVMPNEKRRLASGMSKWAWKHRKKNSPDKIERPPVSIWEQRIDEMKRKK